MKIPFAASVAVLTLLANAAATFAQQTPQHELPAAADADALQVNSAIAGLDSQHAGISSNGVSLSLLAVNEPDALEGLAVTNSAGETLGRVAGIVRRNSDNDLHAVIDKGNGERVALALDALEPAAFTFWDVARTAAAEVFVAADYEAVLQDQTGHSSQASLSQPVGDTERRAGVDQERQVELAVSEQLIHQDTGYIAAQDGASGRSSVVQMAMLQPGEFRGKALVGADGEELGRITQIARKLDDLSLHAVLERDAGEQEIVVKLQDLKVERLRYVGGEDALPSEEFVEDAYTAVNR